MLIKLFSIKATQCFKSHKFCQSFVFISTLLSYQPNGAAQEMFSEGDPSGYSWYFLIGLFFATITIALLLIQWIKKNRLTRKLAKSATTDDLTGLMNERQILENVEVQLNKLKNDAGELCIALVDIDWLKQINDKFGYFTGDKVLKLFSELCVVNLPDKFLLGRLGDEKFLVLMPDTHGDNAYLAVEQLRESMGILSNKINMPDLKVTLSAGICEYLKNDTSDVMLQLANTALYRAKRNSKNIVVLCDRASESAV